MELLDIKVPSMLRIQFANLESQQVWGSKIAKAKLLYPRMEYETVAHGVRRCMIDHYATRESLIESARFYAKKGLFILPLEEERMGLGFGHTTNEGSARVFRSVVTASKGDALDFFHAHQKHDHAEIGKLLGFPKDATAFFNKVWSANYHDPIWQQAERTAKPMLKSHVKLDNSETGIGREIIRLADIDDYYLTSSVFRYIGVRILSHFPSSFQSDTSLAVAHDWVNLAKDLKAEGLEETLDIMRLPYEWSALKGVGIINTPVFKFMVNTVPCFPEYVIQKESDFYPKEAPDGVQFPWKLKGVTL